MIPIDFTLSMIVRISLISGKARSQLACALSRVRFADRGCRWPDSAFFGSLLADHDKLIDRSESRRLIHGASSRHRAT